MSLAPKDRLRAIVPVAALLLTVLLGLFAYTLTDSQQQARDDVVHRFDDRAAVSASLTGGLFQVAAQTTQRDAPDRFGDVRVSDARLERHIRQGRQSYAIILDDDGRVLAATRRAPIDARTFGREAHIRRALRGDTTLSDVFASRSGDSVVEFAIPFETATGRRVQVNAVSGGLLHEFLGGYLDDAPGAHSQDRSDVVDSRGRIVASTGRDVRPGERLSDRALLSSLQENPRGSYEASDVDRRFTSSPVPGSTWRVVVSSTDNELFSGIDGRGRMLPWLIFAAFALAGVVALVLLRRVARNTRELAGTNAELAQSNEVLERQRADLSRSNADLEQYAYVTSHDLAEPLRQVSGFVQLLAERYEGQLDEQADEFIAYTVDGVTRMRRLIDDLLAFSRVGRAELALEPVDAATVVEEALEILAGRIEESDAEIEVEELPTIDADAGQLRQLFVNLVGNAIKFAGERAPRVRISSSRHGGEWVFAVEDDGIGIDERHSEQIFKMFQRLHARDEHEGTGIGLAICRAIVERHGGRIWHTPAPGGGSMFQFTFPVRSRGHTPPSGNGRPKPAALAGAGAAR